VCLLDPTQGYEEILRYFLEKGVVPTPDAVGNMPSFYADIKGHKHLKALLEGLEASATTGGASA
jgi:hypothetical protein